MLNKILLNINVPDDTEFVGGWVGNGLDSIGQSISDGIYNGFIAIVDTLCEFVFIGSKVGIIGCVIVYIASKDKKSVSMGIKLLLAYLIATVVRNNI